MTFLTYLIPVTLAALGILSGAYDCWDKKKRRPTKMGLSLFALIALATVGQLYIAQVIEDRKAQSAQILEERNIRIEKLENERKTQAEIEGLIAVSSINDIFKFYNERCIEAMKGNYAFYEDGKDMLLNQLRAAPYFIAEELKENKTRLINAGLDNVKAEEFHQIFKPENLGLDNEPDEDVPRLLEYAIRLVRERLQKEILKGKLPN